MKILGTVATVVIVAVVRILISRYGGAASGASDMPTGYEDRFR
jgi:hypothetical protein